MVKIILVFVAVFLSGCSTVEKKYKDIVGEEHLTEISNNVQIKYDKEGNFKQIISTATAPVSPDLPNGKENAITAATMKARANISEFLNSEITTESFIEKVTNTLDVSNDDKKTKNRDTANKLRESITTKSQSLLKGTYVSKTEVSNKSAVVTVISSSKLKKTLKQIENAITK